MEDASVFSKSPITEFCGSIHTALPAPKANIDPHSDSEPGPISTFHLHLLRDNHYRAVVPVLSL